jgi:hypothetical protein
VTGFRVSAASLVGSAMERQIAGIIADHVRATTGRSPAESERKSWRRSIPILAHDLVEAGLGQVEMLIEYRLPLTSRRADVVLAGIDRRTGEDAYVVVELKQWSQAELYEDNERLVVVEGMHRELEHPLLQVQDYCEYIADFLASLRGHEDAVRGVAYLHNAVDLDVADLFDLATSERTRLFTKSRRGGFLEYLRDQFAPEHGAGAADRLLRSAVRPSKQLLKLAAAEIRDREQFTLLAEQRLAYEIVLHVVEKTRRSDAKEVTIVTGGPGSGKSVIALSLLGELYRQGYSALHATGSRSFTQTMRRHVGRGVPRVKSLFKYFNSFMDARQNDIDVLICDEAHRIRETSANRFTKSAQRTGRPQLDELMAAARVPVFLLDEHQVVKPGELGTVEAIMFRSTNSSDAAVAGSTNGGCCGCSASSPAILSTGPATIISRSCSRRRRGKWRTSCAASSRKAIRPGYPPDIAGRGATLAPMARSSTMYGSAIGPGHGTSRAIGPSAQRRPARCGRP